MLVSKIKEIFSLFKNLLEGQILIIPCQRRIEVIYLGAYLKKVVKQQSSKSLIVRGTNLIRIIP